MKKVKVMFEDYSIILSDDEIKEGIEIYESNDIFIPNVTIKQVSDLLEKYNNDEEINLELDFRDILEDNNIYWEYVHEGYFTEEEFINKYKEYVFVNMEVDKVLDAKGYYDWYEEGYFYTYWDGHNWETLDLEDEGEEVIYLSKLKKENTYEINLYYNLEEKEIFTVCNSYYQGSLLAVEEYNDIDDDVKSTLEDIENLLEKINHEIENNNKYSDKFEGFKIDINVTDEEFETFDYIYRLYDWFEKDGDRLYITSKYK